MLSYIRHGKNYLDKGYWYKKVTRIGIPTLIMLLIYLFTNFLYGKVYSLSDFISGRANFGHFWYMCVIFLLYALFFGAARISKNEKSTVIVNFIFIAIYILSAWKMNLGSYWYYTTLSFPTGILFAYISSSNNKLSGVCNRHNGSIEIVLWISFLVSTYLKINRVKFGIDYNGMGVALTLLSTSIFPLAMTFSLMHIKTEIPEVHGVSMEVFLLHNLIISIFKSYTDFNIPIVMLICVCSYSLAYIFQLIYRHFLAVLEIEY